MFGAGKLENHGRMSLWFQLALIQNPDIRPAAQAFVPFPFSQTYRSPVVNDGRKRTTGALLVNYMPQADEGQIASDEHEQHVPSLTDPPELFLAAI